FMLLVQGGDLDPDFDDSHAQTIAPAVHVELRADGPHRSERRLDVERPLRVMCNAEESLTVLQLDPPLPGSEGDDDPGHRIELNHRAVIQVDRTLLATSSRIDVTLVAREEHCAVECRA